MSDTDTKSKYKKFFTTETLQSCAIITLLIALFLPKFVDLARERSRFENLLNALERAVHRDQGIKKNNGWYYFYLKSEYSTNETKKTLKPRAGLAPVDGWFSYEWKKIHFKYQNNKKIVKGPFLISTDEGWDFYIKNYMNVDGHF